MNDQDLRDCFAMFALCGMIMRYDKIDPSVIWSMADRMIETRNEEPQEVGIVAAKPKRRTKND